MSDVDEAAPDGWTKVKDADDSDAIQLRDVYQRRRDGLVVAIERNVLDSYEWAATALPENYYNDNQPIRRYGDNGYVAKADDESVCRKAAWEWMKQHPHDPRG